MSNEKQTESNETERGTDEARPISNRLLAEKIARHIFEEGSELWRVGGEVQRIQFVGGAYPDKEVPLGGFCEEALASSIERFLSANLEVERR